MNHFLKCFLCPKTRMYMSMHFHHLYSVSIYNVFLFFQASPHNLCFLDSLPSLDHSVSIIQIPLSITIQNTLNYILLYLVEKTVNNTQQSKHILTLLSLTSYTFLYSPRRTTAPCFALLRSPPFITPRFTLRYSCPDARKIKTPLYPQSRHLANLLRRFARRRCCRTIKGALQALTEVNFHRAYITPFALLVAIPPVYTPSPRWF